jgi:ectoine hydroxylase-related dioxygenase (phytanoyl-CoA dioxygenase family)
VPDLDLIRDGAVLHRRLYDAAKVEAIRALRTEGPGTRLLDARLPGLLVPVTDRARAMLGPRARPVRAVMFDKSADNNWALAWHQDRTIVVRARHEVAGFRPWSRKDGALHVAPPMMILDGMATFRIHLDPCGSDNAPLRIALGSHRLGLVAAKDALAAAEALPQAECLAEPGDVWAYATPILHASARASTPSRRRVLQVDYSADDLPAPLDWRGVGA